MAFVSGAEQTANWVHHLQLKSLVLLSKFQPHRQLFVQQETVTSTNTEPVRAYRASLWAMPERTQSGCPRILERLSCFEQPGQSGRSIKRSWDILPSGQDYSSRPDGIAQVGHCFQQICPAFHLHSSPLIPVCYGILREPCQRFPGIGVDLGGMLAYDICQVGNVMQVSIWSSQYRNPTFQYIFHGLLGQKANEFLGRACFNVELQITEIAPSRREALFNIRQSLGCPTGGKGGCAPSMVTPSRLLPRHMIGRDAGRVKTLGGHRQEFHVDLRIEQCPHCAEGRTGCLVMKLSVRF